MFKRLFFAMVGLGAGVALGGYAVRKVERGRRLLTPQGVAGVASSVRDRVATAIAAGRAAAAEREAELRATYGSAQAAQLNSDGTRRPT
jgi:hypothetical protein